MKQAPLICFILYLALIVGPKLGAEFTIVAFPDTQGIVGANPQGYQNMCQWVVDNKDALNIVLVASLGDMTDNGNSMAEWNTVKTGFETIKAAGIPYIPVQGNHDNYGNGIQNQKNVFPVSMFANDPNSGLVGTIDGQSIVNAHWRFTFEGVEIFLPTHGWNNTFDTPLDTFSKAQHIAWANQVIAENLARNPNAIGIYLTHHIAHNPEEEHVKKIIRANDNIAMAICGHTTPQHEVFTSNTGKSQYMFRANWGGNTQKGYVRYYTFYPARDEVEVYTFNTKDGQFFDITTPSNGYTFPLEMNAGAPVVSFSQPSGNDVFLNQGDNLNVTIDATSANGIAHVKLFKDGVELARTDSSAPYQWGAATGDSELMNLPVGSYVLKAVATDTNGESSEAVLMIDVENMVKNSSFETGDWGWTLGTNVSVTQDHYQHGDSSIVIDASSAGSTWQTIPVTPNTDYEISFWARATTLSGGLAVFDLWDEPTPQSEFQQLIGPGDANVWTEFRGSFNSAALSSIRIRFFGSNIVGSVHFDNFKMMPLGVLNSPPVISSTPATSVVEGSLYSYTMNASDSDGDSLSYNLVAKPTWLNWNAASRVLSGIASNADVGNHSVHLTVSDGQITINQQFDIYVSLIGNDLPIITSAPSSTGVLVGGSYNYTLTAFDPDGDSLSLVGTTVPAWMNFNSGSGLLSGSPTLSDVGTHLLELSVNDGTDSVVQSFNIAVFEVPAPANLIQNPSFETGDTSSWTVGSATEVSVSTDSASDGTYSMKYVEGGDGTIPPTRQVISVAANTAYTLNYDIDFTAGASGAVTARIDVGGTKYKSTTSGSTNGWDSKQLLFNSGTFTTVTLDIYADTNFSGTVYLDNISLTAQGVNLNTAPVITSVPLTSADEGVLYSYTLTGADAESTPLTFSASQVPSWLSFNAGTGLLSGTPSASDGGNHSVSLQVSDGEATDTQNFAISVTIVVPNTPPVISSNPVTGVIEGDLYAYIINATDADGDALVYSATQMPSWLSFNPGSRLLSGTPGSTNVGNHSVTLQVSDGEDFDTQSFNVIVTAMDPYDAWTSLHNITDDLADNDNDGISNVMEFALGGNPNSATSGEKPVINKNGSDYEFRFHKGEDSVSYTVEKSSDLINWSTHAVDPGTVGADVSVPVSGSEFAAGKLFLRLRISN